MKEADIYNIGEKIKFFRKKCGLTQAQFAERIGISEKHISKIELGTYIPTLLNFIKILEILNVGLEDFGIFTKGAIDVQKIELFSLLNQSSEKEIKYYTTMIKSTKKLLK